MSLIRNITEHASILCDTCTELPLQVLFNADDPSFKQDAHPRLNFGRLDQIRQKTTCPLCRIIVAAIYDKDRGDGTYHEPDQEITLRWESSSGPAGAFAINYQHGTRICFVKDSTKLGPANPLKSFLTTTEPRLAFHRVQRWLSACMCDHGHNCNPVWSQNARSEAIIPDLEVLRLIDVASECIVERTSPCKYLALSYVWGGGPVFRLTTSNKNALMQPGALPRIFWRLPKTIQDAIELVRALDQRYLWVDTLCLVQNDTLDLQKGVDVMGTIYERAIMTIIAASGSDSNAGLPGVREGSRLISQHVEQIIPGVRLAVHNDLDHLLQSSSYNKRAWTFQEQLFSRRALFFVENQVHFRCRDFTWSENTVDQFARANNGNFWTSSLHMAWTLEYPVSYYAMLLQYYTERVHTNQEDAIRSMAGIINRVSNKLNCSFFQGVPTALFDSFMMFQGFNLLSRRSGFPSYSWAGWRGNTNINFRATHSPEGGNSWLANRTWIVWYKRTPPGLPSLVWDISANILEPSLTDELPRVRYRKRSAFPSRHNFKFSTSVTSPTDTIVFDLPSMPPYPLLQFWTLAVYYTISDIDVFSATASLLDNQQVLCGSVKIDGYEDSPFGENGSTYEFIVLSEAVSAKSQPKIHGHEYPTSTDSGNWKYYNILLLEWKREISERRGVGIIFQRAVEKSLLPGPAWKEIIMA